MFEKEIKFIADVSLNKIKNLGSFITFEKLMNSEIHPAIVQYISAELDYLIHEDRKKLLQQSLFDYSAPEISKYFTLIGQELKRTKKISYEDIKKLILQAVSFNINFLIRPKWSLAKLVYNDADIKSLEEIKLNFNYIYYYEYLKNVFLAYISKRKLLSLSVTEFEMILSKIDKEIFSSDQQKFLDYSLFTMAEFFNLGGVSKNSIPPAAVEIFLKEKELTSYIFKLRKSFPESSRDVKQQFDVEDIRKVIYSAGPVEINLDAPEEKIPAEVNNEPEIDKSEIEKEIVQQDEMVGKEDDLFTNIKTGDEEAENILEEINDEYDALDLLTNAELEKDLLDLYSTELNSFEEEKETEKPKEEFKLPPEKLRAEDKKDDFDTLLNLEEETNELLKNFPGTEEVEQDIVKTEDNDDTSSSDFDNEIEDAEETDIDDLTRSFIVGEDDDNLVEPDADKKAIEDFQKPKPKKRAKELSDFMTKRESEKIVRNVFNDDKEDFESTLEKLEECNSYEEATEILKGVFLTYRINPYSKEAITLTNSVSTYFDQG